MQHVDLFHRHQRPLALLVALLAPSRTPTARAFAPLRLTLGAVLTQRGAAARAS